MKKYILLLIAVIGFSPTANSQTNIDIDSINLQMEPKRFRVKKSNPDVLEYIPIKNEVIIQEVPKTRNVSTKSQSPAMSPLSLTQLPYNYTIDKSKGVGEITINSKVENGVSTHRVPIEAYATTGLQPELSFAYNSLAESGLIGYGWNIGGVSNISVTHSNYYYEGANYKPIQLNKASSFTLDGIKLIVTDATSSKTTYMSEHGKIKVISHMPSGKYYFEVFYPDGNKATFGYKENIYFEKVYPNGKSPVDVDKYNSNFRFDYPITRLEDLLGNYIEYNYEESNYNFYYLTSVKYGSGSTPIGSINFTYQDNPDARLMYKAGRPYKNEKLLTEARTYFQSTLLRTYTLNYEKEQYYFLSKISCKAGSQELNPLLFYYGGDSKNKNGYFQTDMVFLGSYFSNSDVPNLILEKGKFNGLSTSDGLIAYPKSYTFYGITRDKKGNCEYESQYASDQELLIFKNLDSYISTPNKIKAGKGFQGLYPIDYNGDGNDELVRVNYWLQDKNYARVDLTTYDKNMNPSSSYYLLEGTFNEGNYYSAVPRIFLTGDFTGTGKAQLLTVSGNKMPKNVTKSWSRTTIINLETNSKMYDNTPFLYDYFEDAIFAIDYDGDGRTDICLINSEGTYIYSYQDYTFKQIAFTPDLYNSMITGDHKKELMLGDMNGDGLIDFVLSPKKDDTYKSYYYSPCMYCSKCKGGSTSNGGGGSGGGGGYDQPLNERMLKSTNNFDSPTQPHNHVELVDQNSNSNIISPFNMLRSIPTVENCLSPVKSYRTIYYSTYKTWTILTNTGRGFIKSNFEFYPYTSNYIKFLLQDINGDYLPDLIYLNDSRVEAYLNDNGKINTTKIEANTSITSKSHFITGKIGNGLYNNSRPSQLLSIKDAKVTTITFSKNDARERMLTGVVNSLGVVESYNYSNLTSGTNYSTISTNTFAYPYRKLNVDMNVVSSHYKYAGSSYVDSYTYHYNDVVVDVTGGGFRGFQKITVSDNIRNNKIIQTFDPKRMGIPETLETPTSLTRYTHSVNIERDKRANINMTSKVVKDKLNDNLISTYYTYDTYGSNLTEVTYFGNEAESTKSKKVNNYISGTYLLGEVYEESVTDKVGNETVTNKTLLTYNTKHQPATIRSYYNNNLVGEEAYSYDSYNNMIESKKKQYNSPNWLSTKYEYDTYRRITKEVDPLGLFIIKTYNTKGEIVSTKDHRGLETKYLYDVWGRVYQKTYPDGTSETSSLAWSNTVGLYKNTNSGTGKPNEIIYFDLLARKVRSSEIRFDGKESKVDTKYDNSGRVANVSVAFTGASPSHWSSVEYDIYDRVISSTAASGNKTTYQYGKNTNTIIVDSVPTTTTYNIRQQEISVKSPSGTILNKYRADGQLNSTTVHENVTTSFEYDAYGRQTAIIDPSFGKKTFVYDINGNIVKETDSEGQILTKVYDTFGRLIETNADGIKTTIAYNKDNLVQSYTESNGYAKICTYHPTYYDRIEKEKETIQDGKWIEKTNSYSNGQLTSIAYKSSESPNSNFAIENYSYANGHLVEIKLGTTSVWKLNTANDMGLSTQVTTGGLVRTYSYTEFGAPVARVVKKGSAVIQNFSYQFNTNTGNLKWRRDNTRNIQENFQYDTSNRLTYFGGKAVKYDNRGNIADISTIGSFAYKNAQPYAVASFSPYGISQISAHQQTITYNTLMRPLTIQENNVETNFLYNSGGFRTKMTHRKNNKDELTRYYLSEGKYEIERGIAGNKEKLYIGGDVYTAFAVYIKEAGAWTINYICRDYLGSITHITDANGTLRQELSYDPWGRLRNPVNHVVYNNGTEPKLLLDRGYTGHEHLLAHNLINMNARLYDPVLCRFLSPDPFIQNPSLVDNYNRYTYAMNNPFRFTDPSGEIAVFIPFLPAITSAIFIGAGIAGGVYLISVAFSDGGFRNWNWGSFAKSVATGIVSGFFTGSVGAIFAYKAPAFTVSGTSFMGCLPAYLGKAGWVAMASVASAGSSMFVADLFDDGRINTKGLSYLKGIGISGLTSGLISFTKSMHSYATWDRYTKDEKLDILRKQYPKLNLIRGDLPKEEGHAKYNPYTGITSIDNQTLDSKANSKYALMHETFHQENLPRTNFYGITLDDDPRPTLYEAYRAKAEKEAHGFSLPKASSYNLTLNEYTDARGVAKYWKVDVSPYMKFHPRQVLNTIF